MSLAAAGARGGLVTIGGQIALLSLRTASILILARLLAPEVFGVMAIAATIVTFVTSVIFLGLPMAVAQAQTISARASSSLLLINSSLGGLMAGGLFLLASPISELYDEPSLVFIAHWLAIVPLLSGINAQFRQRLINSLRFGALSLTEVLGQSSGIVTAIILAAAGASYQAIVGQMVVASTVQFALTVALARWLPGLPGAWRTEVIPLLRIGSHIFGMNLLRSISRNTVVPVLGLVASPSAVGQFDRAQQLTLVPINLTVDQLQRVVVPVLSHLRGQPGRMLAYMRRFQLVSAYLTSTCYLLVAALGQPLFEILLGPGWDLAAAVAQVLAIGGVFRSAGQSMQWLFISSGETRKGLRFTAWSQPLVTALSLTGLPWGVIGVALTTTIAWALYWPASAWAASRASGLSAWALMSNVVRGSICFALPVASASLLGLTLANDPLLMLVIGAACGAASGAIVFGCISSVRRDLRDAAATLKVAMARSPRNPPRDEDS